MGFFNMYFNETIHPINVKYATVNTTTGSFVKQKTPPYFFDDRYKNRLLKLKNQCFCCYADSTKL